MIVVTGAAGFIGSCFTSFLNQKKLKNIILVDDFTRADKAKNIADKNRVEDIERGLFFEDIMPFADQIEFIFHLGARTDTTEQDETIFNELNLDYSKAIWKFCVENMIPLVYASSAATYGDGAFGFADEHEVVEKLLPLNPYGRSKNDFDAWALKQKEVPPFWAGLKFFNVYGPNEYHKGRMASVVFHAFHQIQKTEKLKLFRSHRPDFKNGEQSRDFIYVKDLCEVLWFFCTHETPSGLYNLGTGKSRTFNDLAKSIFAALGKETKLEYIDTPADIREKYQYFTEAKMDKLRDAGYEQEFTPLEDGVKDYVQEHLKQEERIY